MNNWHVEPVNDLKPHDTCSEHCACEPSIETQPNGNKVIVHNSYDGREFFETEEKEGH